MEKVYDEEFSPLIDKLINLSKKYDIPLHVTVQFSHDSSSTTHAPGSRSGTAFHRLAQVSVYGKSTEEAMASAVTLRLKEVLQASGIDLQVMNSEEMQEELKNEGPTDEEGFPLRRPNPGKMN